MQRKLALSIIVSTLVLTAGAWLVAAEAPPAGVPDDGIQGVYLGTMGDAKARADVIGEGKGAYRAVITSGEGAGAVRVEMTGKLEGGKATFTGKGGESGTIADKKFAATAGDRKLELTYAVPKSPTEGAKPPAGAVVLLPYEPGKPTSLQEWTNQTWFSLPDGVMQIGKQNTFTKKSFSDVQLHVEFRCPYMPEARGQGRGNSGVYLQSRYEVQVLDSFGLAPKDNECGGIYSVGVPKVNASFPPTVWQTYDVTFHTPTVENGKIVKPATITVLHNGVKIHENVKIDHVTTAGVGGPIVTPAPLMLQDHGNPVQYRNIWIVELKGEGAK